MAYDHKCTVVVLKVSFEPFDGPHIKVVRRLIKKKNVGL